MSPSTHDDYYDDHTVEHVADLRGPSGKRRGCFPSSVVMCEIPDARAYRSGYYY
jgi:hypothetical protein